MTRIRSRGEGSISKRKDGRFEVRLSQGTENGKRRRVYLYAKTRPDAVRLLAQARTQNRLGANGQRQTAETVEHFLTRWLTDHVAKTKRRKTVGCYETIVRLHINPVIGSVRLTELTPEHVDAVVSACQAKGLAPLMVRRTLGTALNRAVKWRIPGVENVVRMTDAPKVEKRKPTFLDPEQAKRFLQAIKGDRLEVLYLVGIYCGLRIGELQGLRWQDVDLDMRQLRVAGQLRSASEGIEEVKTKSSAAIVDMPDIVALALRDHRKRQTVEQGEAGEQGIPWLNEWGLVFTGQYGSPTCRTTIHAGFHGILEAAGLPSIRLHDLRHSCASLLFAAGVDLKTVSTILRHSKVATTADIYTHVIPAVRREAADALARLLG